jgi:hypothetical protein
MRFQTCKVEKIASKATRRMTRSSLFANDLLTGAMIESTSSISVGFEEKPWSAASRVNV